MSRKMRKDTEAMEPEEREPRQSNGLQWWKSPPPYKKPSDDDICGEPLEDGSGFCTKTVGQHRAEFRAFGAKIAARVKKF